jgi:hypothetical protein
MTRDNDRQARRIQYQPSFPSAADACHGARELENVADDKAPAVESAVVLGSVFSQELGNALLHRRIVDTRSFGVDANIWRDV